MATEKYQSLLARQEYTSEKERSAEAGFNAPRTTHDLYNHVVESPKTAATDSFKTPWTGTGGGTLESRTATTDSVKAPWTMTKGLWSWSRASRRPGP